MSQLKSIYTEDFLIDFSNQITKLQNDFNSQQFIADILNNNWDDLTVRQRMKKIATTLGFYLEGSYENQLPLILKLHENNTGFNYLFLPDFVSIYGLSEEHFFLSLEYLKKLTPYSSSEFAIREFLLINDEKVLPLLLEWSLDENEHVRRLASEGSRPRLPWGVRLDKFNDTPELVLPILTNLKADSSLYVRKSVANHLNDLSKDHPDLIINLCKSWLNQTPETDWIIKRACRTLIKKAYPSALDLFGYEQPGTTFDIKKVELRIQPKEIRLGESLTFDYKIETTIKDETPVRLEFGVDYMKANGKPSLKKFYLSDGFIHSNKITGKKTIHFKDLSTRKHYPGTHQIYLYLNGLNIASDVFTLKK